MPGILISAEGLDKSGKSTQVDNLVKWLGNSNYAATKTREPSNLVRHTVTSSGVGDLTRLLLFLADRIEHTEGVILPALEKDLIVVCDRYFDCTYAYQLHENNHPVIYHAGAINQHIARIPDLTLFIDTPLDVCYSRYKCGLDYIESQPREYHERVVRGYHWRASVEPARIKIIDGDGSEEEVFQRVLAEVIKSGVLEAHSQGI